MQMAKIHSAVVLTKPSNFFVHSLPSPLLLHPVTIQIACWWFDANLRVSRRTTCTIRVARFSATKLTSLH